MTLQNGLVHGGKVHLWCDTAYLNASTGKVACFDSKAFTGLLWPFAGTMSLIGPTVAAYDIPAAIGAAYPMNVDELLSVTRKALLAYADKGGTGRVLIGAWQDEPRLFVVATDGAGQVEPFEPAEVDFYCSSGNRSTAYQLAVANGFTPDRMMAVIDAQRAETHDGPLGEGHWIGGNAAEFTIAETGITSRVAREWGDRVGERIEPTRAFA